MIPIAIYCRIAGEDELLGVRGFAFAPRAGETVVYDRHGEGIALHVDRVEHRISQEGHLPKLLCSRVADRD